MAIETIILSVIAFIGVVIGCSITYIVLSSTKTNRPEQRSWPQQLVDSVQPPLTEHIATASIGRHNPGLACSGVEVPTVNPNLIVSGIDGVGYIKGYQLGNPSGVVVFTGKNKEEVENKLINHLKQLENKDVY